MPRMLKVIGIAVGALVLSAVVAVVCLVTFVSPNRLKPFITEQVKKYTGRDMTIDGDLSWTVFPYLGVKVGHLELNNPPGFKQKIFAEIQSATVAVKVMPLLHAKVESKGMTLKGLKLFLIKNAAGKTNWSNLQTASVASDAASPSAPETVKKTSLGLAVSGIHIANATVVWINEKTNQSISADHFELRAKDITLTHSFPLSASFHITGKNPELNGTVSLTSHISLNVEKQLYLFDDLSLTANIAQNQKKWDIRLKGNVAADLLRETLQVDNLVTQNANLTLTGKINMTDLATTPAIVGHIQIQPVDMKKWLQLTGQDVTALQAMNQVSGDIDFTGGLSLSSLRVKGNFKADNMVASKMHMTKIAIQTHLQKGVLQLAPITAAFYQGNLDGSAKVDLNSATPHIAVQAKMTNVQAEPLLTDLNVQGKLKFTGTGNVNLDVTTQGTSGDAVVKNLNGKGSLSFNNGVLQGVDIGYLIDSAYALATKQEKSGTADTNQTQFGTLTGTLAIHQGVINNTDLLINSPRFESKGNGSIDLVNQKINYHVQTTAKKGNANQKNNLTNMYGVPIPIVISGSLNSPSIHMDTQVLMKAIASQQLEKVKANVQQKIQDKISEQIKDKIPEKAGELLNNFLGH